MNSVFMFSMRNVLIDFSFSHKKLKYYMFVVKCLDKFFK